MSKTIIFILIFGLILRIGYVLTLEEHLKFPDSVRYDALAQGISEGRGYPTIATAPVYPFFLSLIYFIFGRSFRTVWIVQSVLDCISILLLYKIASKIINEKAGIIAGILYSLDPFLIFFSGLLLTETLFITVFLGFLLSLINLQKSSSIRYSLLCGVLLAIAALLKPFFLYFGIVMFLVLLLSNIRIYKRIGVVFITTFILMSPWVIRNLLRYETFILTTRGSGITLYESNNPNATGGRGWKRIPDIQRILQMGEIERDNYTRKRAKEFIRNNPGRFLELIVEKQRRFWAIIPGFEDYRTPLFITISLLWTVPVYIFAITGFWKIKNKLFNLFPIWFPILLFTLMHTVILGSIRYRLPIMPLINLYAGVGIMFVIKKIQGGKG
jgi:4-amino-4-deoxy-L-arabinose transferase-like glycosyltransferase